MSPLTKGWRTILFDPNTPNWMRDAACRNYPNPDDFFPYLQGRNRPGMEALQRAYATCATCPVTRECAALGEEADGVGVWGGEYRKVKR